MSKKEIKYQLADESEPSENEGFDSVNQKEEPKKSSNKEVPENKFVDDLEQSLKDLWYMSETDAEIDVFTGKKADAVTKETLAEQTNISSETKIEEKDFTDFFKNLTKIQDWYGDEEKETAAKFSTVQRLLEENLKDLKVFKVGQIEIDIYAVGLDSQSILTGIKTKAVET